MKERVLEICDSCKGNRFEKYTTAYGDKCFRLCSTCDGDGKLEVASEDEKEVLQ